MSLVEVNSLLKYLNHPGNVLSDAQILSITKYQKENNNS